MRNLFQAANEDHETVQEICSKLVISALEKHTEFVVLR